MSVRRSLVSILLTLGVVSLGGFASAQTVGGSGGTAPGGTGLGVGLIVPISGVGDVGGIFGGTLLVQRFVQRGSGIAALGTVTGVMTEADGTVRNLVMQAALPLDVDGSRARLNTDPALAQSSCDVLHVELAGISMNVLGSTIGLNPVAFDVASPLQAGAATPITPPSVTTGTPSTTSATGAPSTAAGSSPVGTVTPSSSANTTQPATSPFAAGVATPGATTPVPAPSASTQAPTALGTLLCSVNGFRDVSNPAQLVRQLNAIVAALGTSGL